VIFQETGDQMYRPARLLMNMVRGNLLGRKNAKDFHLPISAAPAAHAGKTRLLKQPE
jgi:3-hydroxyacyl-CoA dehydrogenase